MLSHLAGGVYWEHNDLMVEDIERIEVIRGPGTTTWGVNAVNGVINIITRRTADTTGTLVSARASQAQPLGTSVRHGAALNSEAEVPGVCAAGERRPFAGRRRPKRAGPVAHVARRGTNGMASGCAGSSPFSR